MKVDQIKSEVEKDELNSIKEVDISKIINKNVPQSNGAQQPIKIKQERWLFESCNSPLFLRI